jgi:hypothetical protein
VLVRKGPLRRAEAARFSSTEYPKQITPRTVYTDSITPQFIRLFLQHSLPTGLQRIRYYGFLTNRHRAAKLLLCRKLLATRDLLPRPSDYKDLRDRLRLCPKCGIGIMVRLLVMLPCHGPGPSLTGTS